MAFSRQTYLGGSIFKGHHHQHLSIWHQSSSKIKYNEKKDLISLQRVNIKVQTTEIFNTVRFTLTFIDTLILELMAQIIII